MKKEGLSPRAGTLSSNGRAGFGGVGSSDTGIFEHYVLGFFGGRDLDGPELDLRIRSLISIAALAGSGRQQGLDLNIRIALTTT